MHDTKMKIAAHISSHFHLRLATVTPSKNPQVHTVGYIAEECTVYFVTDRKSRKVENICRQPAVAYAVDENYEDITVIKGVQMEGRASPVSSETKAIRILGLMAQKFPGMTEMELNPDLVIFKIEPARGYFLDNPVAFGHRDMVNFQ